MTDDLDVYQGRARRRCENCGVEVEVEKPTRVLSRTFNRAWRKKARQELARQLLWEACARTAARSGHGPALNRNWCPGDGDKGRGTEPAWSLESLQSRARLAAGERGRLPGCKTHGGL